MKRFTILIAAAVMLLAILLQPVRLWGQSRAKATLTNANIVAAGSAADSYQSWSITDGNSKTWNAYAIKKAHSGATSAYHFLQIKKYASSTAYYIQVPEYGTKITQLKMTVSSTSKPMTGGGNTATLYFSSSNSTSSTGTGVVSGTGDSSITIDCSSLNLNTGYITASGGIRIWDVEVTYNASHTLTYSATNGGIVGVDAGSNAVASGASIAEGATVTLTATPSSGYNFSGWEVTGTGSSLTSTSTNPTTFTMGTTDATVTATFVAAGNYINVTPNPANVAVGGGSTEFSVATNQTLTASNVQFYTAATSGSETDKPDWIGTITYSGSSSPYTLTVPVSANTGVARSAFFTLKNNTVESSVVTINQAAITVEAPTFTPAAGTYYENQSVEIACSTDGATIYYTTNGSDPTSSSTPYTSAISVTSNQTIKAIAIKNSVSSSVATALIQ